MFPLIGSLIGAGANILGGMMGQENNAQNVQMQEQINAQNLANQNAINQQNIAEQEKFAQSGIQWRVADAKAAGISPLAALGAQTASFSNNVGTTLQAPKVDPSVGIGAGIASAGQDVSRAMAATRSPEEQAVAIEKTRQDLESGQLDNELKKATLASSVGRLRSAQTGPGMPKPPPVESQFPRSDSGAPVSYPSRDVEGAAWIDPLAKSQWMVTHQALPAFGYNIPKELGAPAEDRSWYRNPLTGSYYQFPSAYQMYHIMKKDLFGWKD